MEGYVASECRDDLCARHECIMTNRSRAMALPVGTMLGQRPRDAPVAHTALGDLRGFFIDGIAAFDGVPYAAPPIGCLRFAPAEPISAWEYLRDATRHGPIPPQLPPRLSVGGMPAPR